MNTHTTINLTLLENIYHASDGKITARCPACSADNGDETGNHFCIYPNGAYACVVYPKNDGADHRKRIFELVGIREVLTSKRDALTLKRDAEHSVKKHLEKFRTVIWSGGGSRRRACSMKFLVEKPALPGI